MDWDIVDLDRMGYAEALEFQRERNLAVSLGEARPALILVEHHPVITVSHRKGVRDHVLATPERLEELGIEVCETDRGGDVTYHGPGQLVAYPILRLNDHGLNLGRYMRLLEQVVIGTAAAFGVEGHTETGATGVWVAQELGVGGWDLATNQPSIPNAVSPNPQNPKPKSRTAKLCAMGVRIRKNTTMHGLAINVTTDLSHFQTIDPCGLGNRPVTSLQQLLGGDCPSIDAIKQTLAQQLASALKAGADTA
ncbi:lipoyl(octanoyl) transferase LipB [Algisphaera agarilytica]|uniref:Octanoyltransferase n=1 Tax=Algisphaera agarilytica TaxID=1385975 RepID=A0A7X0H3Q7_9BACT|nr:lipoyl(octanoyl) transferase [Algisphaera agarilytica]MBB6428727.1 lipoyl(octanoyl) transferase [Algisphaera agarilytica]